MIIRMTLNDNDFGELMEMFVKGFPNRITALPKNIETLDGKEQFEIIKEIRKIDKLLNPNITENYTKEEKDLIIKKINESFKIFVENHCDLFSYEYLKDNFKVEIIDSMEDKWENGEVWYWFQHSGVFLNQ